MSDILENFRKSFQYTFVATGILGLVGNPLMFVVYSKPNLKKLTVSIYFRAIALVNLLANFSVVIQNVSNFDLKNEYEIACRALSFTDYSIGSIIAWYLIIAGLEQLRSIFYAKKCSCFYKIKCQLIWIFCLTFYNLIFYSHLLFGKKLILGFDHSKNSTFSICADKNLSYSLISDLINSAVLPFFIMISTSIATIIALVNSNRHYQQALHTSLSVRNHARDIRFGVTLVVLNMIFLITNATSPFFNAIVTYAQLDLDFSVSFVCDSVFSFMYYAFYSIPFYIQLIVNKLFRKNFFELFK